MTTFRINDSCKWGWPVMTLKCTLRITVTILPLKVIFSMMFSLKQVIMLTVKKTEIMQVLYIKKLLHTEKQIQGYK